MKRPGCPLKVLCTFNLRFLSRGRGLGTFVGIFLFLIQKFLLKLARTITQPTFTCSRSAMETPEISVKFLQS